MKSENPRSEQVLGSTDQCARCKVRDQSYDDGPRDALIKSAEAMFRAMNQRGLRAVEILQAAQAVGEGPVADFLALLESRIAEVERGKGIPSLKVASAGSDR